MEAPKSDAPKLPDMVMCGDHPSFTKTELNVKTDPKMDEKDKDKEKEKVMPYAKITPSGSRTERPERPERAERCEARSTSEHALRLSEARRRVRSLEVVQRPDVDVQATGNRALVHAALGSFRWPPYLLCVWVLVLVLTHVLHCLVSLLERALPALRKCTQFFRTWTEAAWRGSPASSQRAEPASSQRGERAGSQRASSQRAYPVALALLTALLYVLYYALYAAYAVVLWAIEPLCGDGDDSKHSAKDMEPKVTNYDDDLATACYKP